MRVSVLQKHTESQMMSIAQGKYLLKIYENF